MRALAIFVTGALIVAVSGIAVILWAQSANDFDPELHYEFHGMGAMFVGLLVFATEAVIVAVVSVRRYRLTEWVAGYAGVVVGIVPYWIMFTRLNATACGPTYVCPPDPGAGEILIAAAESLVLMAVPVAGVIFLAVGLAQLAGRPSSPRGPTQLQ